MFRKIILIFSLAAFLSCAHTSRTSTNISTEGLSSDDAKELARVTSIKADYAKSKVDKARLALSAIEYANVCLKDKKDAACLYYRAKSTGIYYSAHIVGYQKGLKEMLSDCEEIIKLDPTVEHAGAYRIKAQIYLLTPSFALGEDDIVKDSGKAMAAAILAVVISPDYPENQILLAATCIDVGDYTSAVKALDRASAGMNKWRSHEDYRMWQKEMKELYRAIGNLTI